MNTTYRELFEESLDDWIGKGSGIGFVFELIHKDRDVWLYLFLRWLREQSFVCEKCGERFAVEDLDDLDGLLGVVCPPCRRIS